MRCSKYYIDIKIFKTLTLLCLLDGNICCAVPTEIGISVAVPLLTNE